MNILVFCPNWVGDAVMATPALRSLRRCFSDARILGLGKPVIAEVLWGLPLFDAYCHWDHRAPDPGLRTRAVLRALRREPVDLAVLFTNSFRTAWLAWLSGARRRIGYSRDLRGCFLTERLQPLREGRRFVPRPAIDTYLELVYALGCPQESRRMDLQTSPASEEEAERVWRDLRLSDAARVVVLNPGAAYGRAKLWPTAHFVELARRLVELPGTRVLVLCGPRDRELALEIERGAGSPGVHSLAGHALSVGLSKACVRRSQLLVTTDSGPRHFAAAFGVPVVTLFGPTHIAWSETYYPQAVHLQKEVPCGPCQLKECPLDHRCMRDLLPEEVLHAAVDLLARFPRPVELAQAGPPG